MLSKFTLSTTQFNNQHHYQCYRERSKIDEACRLIFSKTHLKKEFAKLKMSLRKMFEKFIWWTIQIHCIFYSDILEIVSERRNLGNGAKLNWIMNSMLSFSRLFVVVHTFFIRQQQQNEVIFLHSSLIFIITVGMLQVADYIMYIPKKNTHNEKRSSFLFLDAHGKGLIASY